MHPKLTIELLKRRAVVYIRQSSPGQVVHNLESQRRQCGLADHARQLGFQEVQVIDEDLGRSGSGKVERPGFERLVAEVCSEEVGAVLCIEASCLARSGRDWHHLIEICGLVRTVVVDPDGIYDPCILNGRLLLGLKGTMSEFELNLLRQRSLEAIRQKARRGELQSRLPVGYRWTASGKIEVDPDRRAQQAVELIFAKVAELGSARQALLWFRREKVSLPKMDEGPGREITWKLPVYNTIWGCCEIRYTRALTHSTKRNRGLRLSMAARESPKDTLNRLRHGWSCFAITMPGMPVGSSSSGIRQCWAIMHT